MTDADVSCSCNSSVQPLLSILIPAYCYPTGVAKILDELKPALASCSSKIEVLVFDDSPNADVESTVGVHCRECGERAVVYQRNIPASGAVGNWNSLLDAARGKYCLLMHHDEFPVGGSFVEDIVNELTVNPALDVLLLDCFLVNSRTNRNNRHLPMWLRAFVIKNIPGYLLRRNVVGPTSSIVIRRNIYPRFNAQLRWLVDVDLYYRVLKSAKNIGISRTCKIGSFVGRDDSITAKLGGDIGRIKQAECDYLRKTYTEKIVWLDMQHKDLSFATVMGIFELLVWGGFRMVNRSLNIFGFSSIFIMER